ncbi:MAG: type II secretion system protein [Candidimonas sp.]
MKAIMISKPHQSGWSLIELILVTTILGILSVGSWLALTPNARLAASEHAFLARARYALMGYALVNHRLPFADQSGTRQGNESPNAIRGWLAVRTLGLPDDLKIEYAVDPVLVEAPRIRFSPAVSNYIDAPPSARSLPNGFDLCSALVTTQRAGTLLATSGEAEVPMAYALLYRSPLEDNTQTGHDAILRLPGVHSEMRRHHTAAGSAELIQALGCPSKLTKAAALAVQAQASAEIPLLAKEYREYRQLRYDAAIASEFGALVEVIMDNIWIGISLVDVLLLQQKIIAQSSPFSVAMAQSRLVLTTTVLARQVAGLHLDAQALSKAPQNTADAANALMRAYRWETRAYGYANDAMQHASKQLQRGLLP